MIDTNNIEKREKKSGIIPNVFIIVACVIGLVVFCLYSYYNFGKYDPSVHQFLKDMDEYDGKLASNRGQITYINNETYLQAGDITILLKSNTTISEDIFGYTQVLGYYRKPGYIEIVEYKNLNYNYVKYILSFIGALICIFIFFKEWKLTKEGFVEKDKKENRKIMEMEKNA